MPPAEGKQQEEGKVGSQQGQMKGTVQEDGLRKEAPVHCPLEEKLTAKVKGAGEVANGVLQQEGQSQYHLRMGCDASRAAKTHPSLQGNHLGQYSGIGDPEALVFLP